MSESCGFDLPMLGAMNDQYRGARGLHRKILPVSVSETKARGMGFVVSQGVRGRRTWADWLQRQYPATRHVAWRSSRRLLTKPTREA